MKNHYRSLAVTILLGAVVANAHAEISAEEAARLGNDLTPLGAIKAGNADGSIPAWEGGLSSAARAGATDHKPGQHLPDPYAADKPLFTITPANANQYAARLTEGHKALLRQYPTTFKMPVYPSRRSAAVPERIYAATRKIATTAKLAPGGNGVTGAVIGIPFPIPKTGIEPIWNHILRYRADAVERIYGQAAVTRSGEYTMVKFREDELLSYSLPDAQEDKLDNTIIYFIQETLAPARLAGEILLVHETLDQAREHRRAWLYNPGQRRVRRAPNVAFDNPGTASDGLRTSDQLDTFNGSPERYDWTLVGRKEMYVPYNSYQLNSDKYKYSDVLKPLHINQDLTRYELHRVWVVDAVLKPGTRHLYKRRTFYIDEDSWQILAVDCYDNRDQLWRVQESHSIQYYDVPTFWTALELTIDLQAGRYLALGLDNEEPRLYDFSIKRTPADYTAAALRNRGVR